MGLRFGQCHCQTLEPDLLARRLRKTCMKKKNIIDESESFESHSNNRDEYSFHLRGLINDQQHIGT